MPSMSPAVMFPAKGVTDTTLAAIDLAKEPAQLKGRQPRGFQIHKVQAAAQRAKGNNYQGPDDDGSD